MNCSRLTQCSRPLWNRWGGKCQRLALRKHWRSSPPPWPSIGAASSPLTRSGFAPQWNRSLPASGETDGLHLLPFDGGLELRSTNRTKGTAVAQILAQEPAALPAAYLGDDLTDEDAFAAIGSQGYSILVRSEVRESPPGFGFARRKSCWSSWTSGSQRATSR